MRVLYLQVCSAYFFPDSDVVEEIARSLPNSPSHGLQTDLVVQLIEQPGEEPNVSTSVHKVSAWSLIVRLPDLNGHALRKHLLVKLVLCAES